MIGSWHGHLLFSVLVVLHVICTGACLFRSAGAVTSTLMRSTSTAWMRYQFLWHFAYSVLHFGKYLDAPLALRLPETAKQIIVNDSSSSMKAPAGTSASSKASVPSHGQKDMAVSTLV
jgi:hypothetical protein